MPNPNTQAALERARAHRESDLQDLFTLLEQPSISAQNIGVAECADLEEALLQEAGFSTNRLEAPGHPVIYGEWINAPGKPTVLFYGHYDVQPLDLMKLRALPHHRPARLRVDRTDK